MKVNPYRVFHSSTRIGWLARRYPYGAACMSGFVVACLVSLLLRAMGLYGVKCGAIVFLIAYCASGVAYGAINKGR